MAETELEQTLARVVQQIAPDSRLLRSWPLNGGISAQMTALALERPDGSTQKLIVRRPGAQALAHNPQAAAEEYRYLQLTQALGLPTQTPYLLDESGAIFDAPYLVVEYIEGEPDFAPVDRATYSRELAIHLAKIHSADITQQDVSFLRVSPDELAGHIGPSPAQVDESLDEGRIRSALAAAWPLRRRNPVVLLHGDYWPGNILWREGRLVAVIDWEDATLGDPLLDLAISRLDIQWILGDEALHAFTEEYRSRIAIDFSALPCWDLVAALRLVRMAGANLAGWAAFYPPFGRYDITVETIRAHYKHFVARALAAFRPRA